MKLIHLTIATAAVALAGGAAYGQQAQPPAAPTPGSVTGDWNGAHAPPDNKQYQEKATVPLGSLPSDTAVTPPPADTSAAAPPTASTEAAPPPAAAASSFAQNTSFSSMTVTNGPIPDTAENRAKYGQPLSRAGKRTAAKGN
jgi:hypothetical protein